MGDGHDEWLERVERVDPVPGPDDPAADATDQTDHVPEEGVGDGAADELEADNPVEEDTIETVEPGNQPG